MPAKNSNSKYSLTTVYEDNTPRCHPDPFRLGSGATRMFTVDNASTADIFLRVRSESSRFRLPTAHFQSGAVHEYYYWGPIGMGIRIPVEMMSGGKGGRDGEVVGCVNIDYTETPPCSCRRAGMCAFCVWEKAKKDKEAVPAGRIDPGPLEGTIKIQIAWIDLKTAEMEKNERKVAKERAEMMETMRRNEEAERKAAAVRKAKEQKKAVEREQEEEKQREMAELRKTVEQEKDRLWLRQVIEMRRQLEEADGEDTLKQSITVEEPSRAKQPPGTQPKQPAAVAVTPTPIKLELTRVETVNVEPTMSKSEEKSKIEKQSRRSQMVVKQQPVMETGSVGPSGPSGPTQIDQKPMVQKNEKKTDKKRKACCSIQ